MMLEVLVKNVDWQTVDVPAAELEALVMMIDRYFPYAEFEISRIKPEASASAPAVGGSDE